MNKTFAMIRYVCYIFIASLVGGMFNKFVPSISIADGMLTCLLTAILWEVLDWKYSDDDKREENNNDET